MTATAISATITVSNATTTDSHYKKYYNTILISLPPSWLWPLFFLCVYGTTKFKKQELLHSSGHPHHICYTQMVHLRLALGSLPILIGHHFGHSPPMLAKTSAHLFPSLHTCWIVWFPLWIRSFVSSSIALYLILPGLSCCSRFTTSSTLHSPIRLCISFLQQLLVLCILPKFQPPDWSRPQFFPWIHWSMHQSHLWIVLQFQIFFGSPLHFNLHWALINLQMGDSILLVSRALVC